MGLSSAREIFISQIKGRIRAYVVREKEPRSKLVKYIKTMCKRYAITHQELKRILIQVRTENVEPFLNSSKGSFYQPERLTRFKDLCRELGFEG